MLPDGLLPEESREKLLTTLPSELLLDILESQPDPDQVILAITCTRFAHAFLNLHPRPVRHLLCQHDNVTGQMQRIQDLPLTCSLLRRLPTFHGDSAASWKFCRNNDCHKPWPTHRDWWAENMAALSEVPDIVGWRRLKFKRAYIWWCIDNCMYPSFFSTISISGIGDSAGECLGRASILKSLNWLADMPRVRHGGRGIRVR